MYRVDRRDFRVGDQVLPPPNSYQENLDPIKQRIEDIMSEEKPETKFLSRKDGLYVFLELSDAVRMACIMTNAKIYRVVPIAATQVSHLGDMNWTEVMSKMDNNEEALRALATHYWTDGFKTFKPCWEALVNVMQVDSILIANENERRNLSNAFRLHANSNIESVELYFHMLGR